MGEGFSCDYLLHRVVWGGNTWIKSGSVPLLMVSLSVVSVTCGQPWPKNMTLKILELDNSCMLNCTLFWVAWWNCPLSHSIPLGTLLILCPVSAGSLCYLQTSHLGARVAIRSPAETGEKGRSLAWHRSACGWVSLILLTDVSNERDWWCWQCGCAKVKP